MTGNRALTKPLLTTALLQLKKCFVRHVVPLVSLHMNHQYWVNSGNTITLQHVRDPTNKSFFFFFFFPFFFSFLFFFPKTKLKIQQQTLNNGLLLPQTHQLSNIWLEYGCKDFQNLQNWCFPITQGNINALLTLKTMCSFSLVSLSSV